MPKLTIDVGFLLLLILPGFLAYRFAVLQRADPSQRSAIWQVSEILEHSLYVHLLGIVLVSTVHYIFVIFGTTTHIAELLKQGPQDFLEEYFAEAIGWYVGYATYILIFSAIIGAYDIPSRVSLGIVASLRILKRCRLLGWLPVPGTMHPQEPIWYLAFRVMAESHANRSDTVPYPDDTEGNPPIIAVVRLKNSGDVYVGKVESYAMAPDTEPEKDFLIINTNYYPRGDFAQGLDLQAIDGVGAVLLNSGNVDSIRVLYHPGYVQSQADSPSGD